MDLSLNGDPPGTFDSLPSTHTTSSPRPLGHNPSLALLLASAELLNFFRFLNPILLEFFKIKKGVASCNPLDNHISSKF
jgi:hypothetical protein